VREPIVFYYKYRGRLFKAFLLPFLLSIAISFIPTPRYAADTVLVVRMGSEYVYQPEIGSGQNTPATNIPFDRDQIYKAEVAILGSDDLHAQVIQSVGIEKIYPEMFERTFLTPISDAVHRAIANALDSLGFADEPLSPEDAARRQLADAVLRFDKRLDIFLEKESAVITVTFENRDSAVAVEVLNKLLSLYLDRRRHLYMEDRAQMAQDQVEAAHQKALAAGQALEDFKRRNQIHSIADQRLQLLQERADVEKQRLSVSNNALDEQIAHLNSRLDALDAVERELDTLQHEQQIAEDEYALSSHKLGEANAFEELERERAGGVRVIQPPMAPPEPKRLQFLIIIAGFVLSLFSVMLTAALTVFLKAGFTTPEELERSLGLPVLAVLPYRRKK
jgi:uncharacterized protein involved in exopolysaccharide biosynthesis